MTFTRSIQSYYRLHGRSLPWRNVRKPYFILVSEVMLQQTQVERVKGFYRSFLRKFPTLSALAQAPLSEVLRAWQGLGYNRRAKFLREAARMIMAQHGGKVPRNEAALVALPGIGRNTAGAILAFAFNEPSVFIETNIRRAFIHHFFPNRKRVDDKDILPFVERTLDRKSPREWYYALMDYGAMLGKDKKVINPNRRSKVYKRQGSFEGSDRKIRGQILRTLLQEEKLPLSELRERTAISSRRYISIIRTLEKEGLLKMSRRMVALAK